MVMSIFVFYYQKKGIPSENPFLFRKELKLSFGEAVYRWIYASHLSLSPTRLINRQDPLFKISIDSVTVEGNKPRENSVRVVVINVFYMELYGRYRYF